MNRIHHLKTWPNAWDAVAARRKLFEWRKDDRGFEVGDTLILQKWDPAPNGMGDVRGYVLAQPIAPRLVGDRLGLEVIVTYILRGMFGVPDGYCVLGLQFPGEAAPTYRESGSCT